MRRLLAALLVAPLALAAQASIPSPPPPRVGVRKVWDYCVRNLMGAESAAGYQMIAAPVAAGAGGPDDPNPDDPDPWPSDAR